MSPRSMRERGTISLELAILAIPLILLLMMIWAFGVYAQAQSVTDQAARDAVRAATQSRSEAEAEDQIAAAIDATHDAEYVGQYMDCDYEPSFDPEFAAPPPYALGEMATVTVHVSCTVDLGDVAFLPWTAHLESTFVSPLDTYRGYYS